MDDHSVDNSASPPIDPIEIALPPIPIFDDIRPTPEQLAAADKAEDDRLRAQILRLFPALATLPAVQPGAPIIPK